MTTHIYKCEKCEYETKKNGNLKTHLWQVHDIGNGKIFKCEQKDCEYETKQNGHLKTHLENVHDIGNKVCNYCFGNCFKRKVYKDKNSGRVMICNKCYKKITGYTCRAEDLFMSEIGR